MRFKSSLKILFVIHIVKATSISSVFRAHLNYVDSP